MSEEKQETIEETPETEVKQDLVDINVALLIADRDSLIEQLKDKDELIDQLTKSLANATDLIEEDSKAALVNDIAPKTSIDKKILANMTVDELLKWKKVLDVARIPAFKSGTPMSNTKKKSQKALLDSTFERAQAKRLEAK